MPASNGKRKSGKTKKRPAPRVSPAFAALAANRSDIQFNNDEPRRSAPASPAQYDATYAPTTWGQAPNAAIISLDVPSGQTCLVRTVGVQGLMAAGILQHVDVLTSLVDEKYITSREDGRKALAADKLKDDPDAVASVFEVINKVVCHAVVAPPIAPVPTIQDSNGRWVADPDPDSRVAGVVYVDTVPEEDQMYIFNVVCGGPQDLASFRKQSEAAVGGLVLGTDVEAEAK